MLQGCNVTCISLLGLITIEGTVLRNEMKRPKTKRPKTEGPRDKTSQGTKRPTLITKFSKTNFVLENLPHMLGNGPHPCTQFMIGVFLFFGRLG